MADCKCAISVIERKKPACQNLCWANYLRPRVNKKEITNIKTFWLTLEQFWYATKSTFIFWGTWSALVPSLFPVKLSWSCLPVTLYSVICNSSIYKCHPPELKETPPGSCNFKLVSVFLNGSGHCGYIVLSRWMVDSNNYFRLGVWKVLFDISAILAVPWQILTHIDAVQQLFAA